MRAHTRLEPAEDHAHSFTWSSCRANLIQRGSALYLRVRDARSPELRSFKGLKWYELDRKFRISGQWTPFSVPKKITMPTADGRTFSDVSLGFVTFTVEGRTVHLEPIQQTDGTLGFLFRDQTSRSTTYGAGIELIAPAPSNGIHASGTVTLDFNNAHNPPCAYTGYATCPIPPKDNQLNVSIPAGEKRYHP